MYTFFLFTISISYEAVCIKITTTRSILLCAVYIPPKFNYNTYAEFLNVIEEIIIKLKVSEILIEGDFNLPNFLSSNLI